MLTKFGSKPSCFAANPAASKNLQALKAKFTHKRHALCLMSTKFVSKSTPCAQLLFLKSFVKVRLVASQVELLQDAWCTGLLREAVFAATRLYIRHQISGHGERVGFAAQQCLTSNNAQA